MGRILAFLEKNRISLLQALAALLLVCFSMLSYYCYWADSEIWGISLARQYGNFAAFNYSIYFKLPFYGLLRLLYEIPGSNARLFDSARLLFCLIGIANAYFAWKLALALSESRVAAALAFVLLLGNTLYINQGFRVRSDLLAAFWHLQAMLTLVNLRRMPPEAGGWRGTLLLFALNALMLASTPKAIYFTLAQLAFAWVWGRGAEPETRRNYYRSVGIAFLSPVLAGILFLAVSRLYSLEGGSNRIFVGYWTAWVYFRDALAAWEPFNFGSERLFFAKNFLARNPDLVALLLLGIFWAPFSPSSRARRGGPGASLAAYGIALLGAATTYNDFLPFFLASLLPVLCVSAALALHELSGSPGPEDTGNTAPFAARLRRNLVLFFALAGTAKAAVFFADNLSNNSNVGQRAAVNILEKILDPFPRTEMYDVIGLRPRQNTIFKFVGPGQKSSNELVMDFLEKRKPEVIPFIRKLEFLEPRISRLLMNDYADLGFGIYGRAITFDLGRAEEVELPYGKYRKISAAGLLEKLEKLPIGKGHDSVWFHLWHFGKSSREGSERIRFTDSPTDEPMLLGSGPVSLAKIASAHYLFLPKEAFSGAVTFFEPIDLPIPAERSVFFLFSFDSLY